MAEWLNHVCQKSYDIVQHFLNFNVYQVYTIIVLYIIRYKYAHRHTLCLKRIQQKNIFFFFNSYMLKRTLKVKILEH